ncbi:hypothetical protein [Streptomyces sp. TR02-1]|uniref:hypothetical protein n=1 Tax=Streptomyces sp. TR02-1 TaxID=3385977 RepID=UPI00399EF84C
MTDESSSVDAFQESFLAALAAGARGQEVQPTVLDTEKGREVILSKRSGGELVDCGTLVIPADTLANRTRAEATRCCTLCPEMDQGMTSQESPGGTYLYVAYGECGHVVVAGRFGDRGDHDRDTVMSLRR